MSYERHNDINNNAASNTTSSMENVTPTSYHAASTMNQNCDSTTLCAGGRGGAMWSETAWEQDKKSPLPDGSDDKELEEGQQEVEEVMTQVVTSGER